jgi:hypothetical protein
VSHVHIWNPAPELGCAMYRCECGQAAVKILPSRMNKLMTHFKTMSESEVEAMQHEQFWKHATRSNIDFEDDYSISPPHTMLGMKP